MIFTERTITVVNDSATINKPLILYRGDKNIELKITIAESQFKFRNTDASNVIETTDASYAQLVINTPYNSPIFSDVAVTKNGAVIFVITEAMIDEIREVGAYEIQIRLLDDNKQSRASIPPVSNAIEIREPIAIEDGSAVDSNAVNVAKVNRALTTTSAPLEAFDSQGNYIKKTWGDGDPITDAALNKMEAAIDGVNKKIGNNRSQIKEIAHKDNVKWSPLDKGYISIIFDDFNDDLADIFTLFKSKNIPLSCAIPAIKVAQGKDTSVLHDIENSGGEIFAHGYTSNPITASSSIDFIKSEFEQSKYLLEKNGLRINGYVRAGGDGSIAFTDILDLFYKNYIYGFSMGEDELLFGRNSLQITLDEFKSKVDNAIANKQWIKFFAHGFHEVSRELLTQMLDYVNSSEIVPVTYATLYSKFVIGNLNVERNVIKSDNLSAFKYIKDIDNRTLYIQDINLLKNSAFVDFPSDNKWIKDKSNYNNNVYWNMYDRGFYNALRVNLSDKATIGSIKIYQDTGPSRINLGEIIHAGLTVQQQTDNNSITLRIYKQLQGEEQLSLAVEKTFQGRLSDEYIYVEYIGERSLEVTNFRYEIELNHPDSSSSNLTFLYLPRLTLKRMDYRYNNITY